MYGKGRTIWKVIRGWGAKFFVQAEIEWKNRTRGVVLKNILHWPKKKPATTLLMARPCSLMYDPAVYRVFKQHFQNTKLKL